MQDSLPEFPYHPDPVATGSVVRSDAVCAACATARGYAYDGPVYGADVPDEVTLCPWCIADGAAHAAFGAEFTDTAGVGNYGRWDAVPASVVEAVAFRTPGFSGWQQEQWWTHCGDAAAFLGAVGYAELRSLGEDAVAALAADCGIPDPAARDRYLRALTRDGSPTGYLFRCRHCGALGGYTDSL